ncbi:MAG: hypothetical protein R3308_04450 [Thiohalobacterales bacterium]|nr:hypothetical protein [Thiohalobacterales bacterium]
MNRHLRIPGVNRRSLRIAALLWLSFLCMPMPGSASPGILIVGKSENGLFEHFRTAFTSHLPGAGSPDGPTRVQTRFLENGSLTAASIPPDTDLVVTVGSAAARAVSELELSIPVLHTLIPRSVYQTIAVRQPACRRQSAIYIDQPLARQIALAGLMFPQRTEYGLLLGPVSARRQQEIDDLQLPGSVRLTVRTVDTDDSTMATGRELLGRSELIVAMNDPLVLSRENAKWLLYVAYQRGQPVIGFSRAYVTAGAAGAVYSMPGQIARQAAETVAAWRASPGACLSAAAFPRYFSAAVNQAVSESLGSALTDEEALAEVILGQEAP